MQRKADRRSSIRMCQSFSPSYSSVDLAKKLSAADLMKRKEITILNA
jgi:hypothetical protein